MSKYLIIVFISLCFALPVTAQKPKASPRAAIQTKVDLGKLDGNTYTNGFFELKIEFPYGWLVGDNVLESQLLQITRPQIKTKNPNGQADLNQAVDRVTPLLGSYKALPGTPENPSLRVMVENLKTLPRVTTGKLYLEKMLASFKAVKLPADFKYSEVKTEKIDNLSLDYLETSTGNNKKRMYVTVRKGFAILITIDSYEDTDFEALHNVLTAADLDYKK